MSLDTYNAAKTYIMNGWHVIPLKPQSKLPAVQSVDEWREKLPDDKTLKRWFIDNPSNNIAILTGKASRLFVIDIDDPSKADGYKQRYPTHVMARSPKGGLHLYYHMPDTEVSTTTVAKLETGVDTRGEGGYIVAAPSQIKYTEPKYVGTQWENYVGRYEWIEFGVLSGTLPDEIIKRLNVQQNTLAPTPTSAEDLYAQVREFGFTPGSHNLEVKNVARYLYRMGATESFILSELDWLNKRDPTPLSDKELQATIRSGIDYEKTRKAEAQKAKTSTEETQQATVDFGVSSLMDVMSRFENYDVNWLIDGWLPENSLIILAAPPESNKTWLLFELAVTAALGPEATPFLSEFRFEFDEPVPVIIVQQEDYIGQIAQRLRTILFAKARDIDYDLVIADSPQGETILFGHPYLAPIHIHEDALLSFDNPASIEGLRKKIVETGAKLVLIDPFYMLAKSDDYFASAARQMLPFKKMRTELGVTFIFVHHTKKSGGEGREKILGSQLLNGVFEGVFLIDKQDGELYISRSGKFFRDHKRARLEFDIDTHYGHEKYVSKLVSGDPDLTGKYDAAVFALLEASSSGLRPVDVSEVLGISRKSAGDVLKKLVELGKAVKKGTSFYASIEELT